MAQTAFPGVFGADIDVEPWLWWGHPYTAPRSMVCFHLSGRPIKLSTDLHIRRAH